MDNEMDNNENEMDMHKKGDGEEEGEDAGEYSDDDAGDYDDDDRDEDEEE